MKIEHLINWFLIVTTGLIFAKLIKLAEISWFEVFIPLMFLFGACVLTLIIGTILVIFTQNKNGEE